LNRFRNPEAWNNVDLLLDALGPRGTSDDETDDDLDNRNPDPRFKSVRRVDMGFLNPAIAKIWASVESYPSSLCPSRGNRAFKRSSQAKTINKNRTPLPGLPINFYDPQWLQASPSRFQRSAKAEFPLPVLVSCGVFVISARHRVSHCHPRYQITRVMILTWSTMAAKLVLGNKNWILLASP